MPVKKVKKEKKVETDLQKLKEYYLKIRFYHKSLSVAQKKNFQITTKYLTEFLFLTAMRNKQARETKWEYINFQKSVIVYPPEAVKKRRQYILPITKDYKTTIVTTKETTKNEIAKYIKKLQNYNSYY